MAVFRRERLAFRGSSDEKLYGHGGLSHPERAKLVPDGEGQIITEGRAFLNLRADATIMFQIFDAKTQRRKENLVISLRLCVFASSF
jgi:hypothetical protein